jgi:hypothetical protein
LHANTRSTNIPPAKVQRVLGDRGALVAQQMLGFGTENRVDPAAFDRA